MQGENRISIKSLFLSNINLRQIVFKNTFWVVLAEVITRILKLVLVVYMARILGAIGYGEFTFALSFVTLFIVFSDLGLSSITIREFSASNKKEEEFFSLLSLKILLAFATAFLMMILSFFITKDVGTRAAIWILSVYATISGFSEIIFAFFRARQQMQYESLAKIFQAVAISVFGFFVIFKMPSVQNISYSYSIASMCALFVIMFLLYKKISSVRIYWDAAIWVKYLKMSWPLALVSGFAAIYYNIDSTIMGYLGQIAQTGWYNAAHKIVIASLIPADTLSIIFYPVLSASFKESAEKFQRVWNYFLYLMVFLAIPIITGGIVFAPKLINLIFGASYAPAILAFQISIPIAGFYFLCAPLIKTLIVVHRQRTVLWAYLAGTAINLALNVVLIPKYSLYGAAVSAVISFFVIFICLAIAAFKFVPLKLFNLKIAAIIICASVSSTIMYAVISNSFVYELNVVVAVTAGAFVYCIFFIIFYFFGKGVFKKIHA